MPSVYWIFDFHERAWHRYHQRSLRGRRARIRSDWRRPGEPAGGRMDSPTRSPDAVLLEVLRSPTAVGLLLMLKWTSCTAGQELFRSESGSARRRFRPERGAGQPSFIKTRGARRAAGLRPLTHDAPFNYDLAKPALAGSGGGLLTERTGTTLASVDLHGAREDDRTVIRGRVFTTSSPSPADPERVSLGCRAGASTPRHQSADRYSKVPPERWGSSGA